jgi:hypothetical protein
LNEVFEGDGDILFEHACKLGCEGYRLPKVPALIREAEEDWS